MEELHKKFLEHDKNWAKYTNGAKYLGHDDKYLYAYDAGVFWFTTLRLRWRRFDEGLDAPKLPEHCFQVYCVAKLEGRI